MSTNWNLKNKTKTKTKTKLQSSCLQQGGRLSVPVWLPVWFLSLVSELPANQRLTCVGKWTPWPYSGDSNSSPKVLYGDLANLTVFLIAVYVTTWSSKPWYFVGSSRSADRPVLARRASSCSLNLWGGKKDLVNCKPFLLFVESLELGATVGRIVDWCLSCSKCASQRHGSHPCV